MSHDSEGEKKAGNRGPTLERREFFKKIGQTSLYVSGVALVGTTIGSVGGSLLATGCGDEGYAGGDLEFEDDAAGGGTVE